MKPNDIKKALQYCQHDTSYCKYCPYESKGCTAKMCEDALNLIEQQEAEVDRLKAQIAVYEGWVERDI